MNHWMKLALPIGLGVVAGIMHYQVLAPKLAPATFAQINCDLAPGALIEENDLRPLELPGELVQRTQQLTPWLERRCHIGRLASRRLRKGDILFLGDSMDPNKLDFNDNVEEAVIVQLDDSIALSGDLRVGASLQFRIRRAPEVESAHKEAPAKNAVIQLDGVWVAVSPASEPAAQSESLGPVRILAIQGDTIFNGPPTSENCRQVTLALPRTSQADQLEPWAERLVAALHHESKDRVTGATVRLFEETAPSPFPASELAAAD
ncbi:MAG: hypothetical protein GXX96_37710 [Planctomycetaceae bacterium]|nr:hypothetical protein [Planctomycetaceae bacterium]